MTLETRYDSDYLKKKIKRLDRITIASFQPVGCFLQMRYSEKKKKLTLNILKVTCIFNSTQSSPLSIILHLTLRIFTLPVLPLRPQRLPTPGVNDFQCIFHFQCYMVLWAGADLAFSQHKHMSTK